MLSIPQFLKSLRRLRRRAPEPIFRMYLDRHAIDDAGVFDLDRAADNRPLACLQCKDGRPAAVILLDDSVLLVCAACAQFSALQGRTVRYFMRGGR